MSQLKISFVNEIKQALKKSVFTLADFEITLPNSGNKLIVIKFIHKPLYLFTLYETVKTKEITTSHNQITTLNIMGGKTKKTKKETTYVELCPGKYKSVEKNEVLNFDYIAEYIPNWCEYIKEDLYALAPSYDPIEQLKKQFNYDFENNIKDPESYFSDEDVDVINKKLESLYEKIEELQEQYELTDKQLKSVENEFNEFKKSAKSYPKGIWARITNNKILEIISKLISSKEGRELIFDELKKLFSN